MSRSFGERSVTCVSSIQISPAVTSSSPASIRRIVDFPQPDGPTRTMNSPSSISSESRRRRRPRRRTPWSLARRRSSPSPSSLLVALGSRRDRAPRRAFTSAVRARRWASGRAPIVSSPNSAAPTTGGTSSTRTRACRATSTNPRPIRPRKSSSPEEKIPPPSTMSTSSRVRWRRRTATPAIRTISSACRSTIARATASSAAAARKTIGVSSTTRRSAIRSKYIASVSCFGRVKPKCRGTSVRSFVGSPRPSSARTECQRAAAPMSWPPPQSPDSSPNAGKRNVRPLGATPEQLVPYPHTTATPHVRSVPARRTANVSLRTTSSSVRPRRRNHRRDPAIVRRQVGARDAVHPELRHRLMIGVEPRVPGCRDHRIGDPFEETLTAGPVVIQTAPACGAQDAPVPPQQHRVDLRPAGVDREESGPPHGRPSSGSSSSRTRSDPAARRPSTIVGSASAVLSGHVWSRTTAPSPCRVDAVDRIACDVLGGSPRLPVLQLDVPVDVAVAEVSQQVEDARIVVSVAERASEPRSGRLAGGLGHGGGRLLHVRADACVGQQRHPGMVVRVVADQVAVIGDPASR